MAADKVHLLLVSDADLILQDFRLFVGVARQDAFQSPVGVTRKPLGNSKRFFLFDTIQKLQDIVPDLLFIDFIQ